MGTNAPDTASITSLDALCPVCRSQSARYLSTSGSTKLLYCNTCRIRFSHPMEHPGQEWYESSDIYEEVRWNLPAISKLGSRWEFARALENIGPGSKTVFDIGCGRGDFLAVAKSHGCAVSGIDLNATLIRVAKEAYQLTDVTQSSIEAFVMDKKLKKFDVVTAFEVLEHLPQPHQFIRQCVDLLNPGGRLMISVPGYDRIPHWVNSPVDLPPHHLVLWSKEGLLRLFSENNLKEIRIEKKPLLLNDITYHAVRLVPGLQRPGLPAKLARGVLKIALIPCWLVLRLRPQSGGFTYLAVGTK